MDHEEGSRILYAEDIDRRIEELERDESLTEEEEEELAKLLRFRQDTQGTLNVWEPSMSFLLDSYFSTWAAQYAEDVWGSVVRSDYFKMREWIDDLRADRFEEVTYGSSTYLADGT